MIKTKKVFIHKTLTKNAPKERELGYSVGLICLSNNMSTMVCSLCKSLEEFNNLLSFINHIKNVHGLIWDSKNLKKNVLDIGEECNHEKFKDCQAISLNSPIVKSLIHQDDYFDYISSTVMENETSTVSSNTKLLQGKQQMLTTKYQDQNFFIKCDKDVDEAIEIHPKEFYCTNCKSNFKLETQLLRHICRNDTSKPELRQHICLKKKRFQCTKCDRCFASKQYFNIHKRIHSGEKPYKCELCLLSFSSKGVLKTHNIRKHIGKIYKCEYEKCARSFVFKYDLDVHMRIHIEEKPYKCELCPLAFSSKAGLKIHNIRKHIGKRYKCEYEKCAGSFASKNYLNIHMRIHSGEKPYKCELCPLSFYSKYILNKHNKSIHIGKRFKCEYEHCNRSFLLKSFQEFHVRSPRKDRPTEHMVKHTKERFICEYEECHLSFSSISNLQRHMVKHNNTKCEYEKCSFSLASISGLQSYKEICHIKPRIIQCPQCEETFRLLKDVNRHLAIEHGSPICLK